MGSRWQDEVILEGRAFFTLATLPPALVIDPSQPDDQGLFTCRVEYSRSPSTFVQVNLSIIIPPDPPSIFWDGKEVMGTIGPLMEGEKAELLCLTKRGRPTPTVTWWQEGRQMESITEAKVVVGETIILSKTIVEADRRLFKRPIVCHAQAPNPGHPLTEPRSVSAILNITLPPLNVKISGLEAVISAGSTVHPICLSAGSHPPAEVTWTLDSKKLTRVTMSVMEGGNVTRSSVTIHTTRHHHGLALQCQAVNKEMPKFSLVDVTKFNIIFRPEVRLELGRMLNASNLVEGRDAFFECHVQANPIPHRIEWFHNGQAVEQKDGVVVSGANLGLQKLKREHSGSYQCAAENMEGKTLSETVNIYIKYAPVCAFETIRTQGAAVKQESKIVCRVEADPIEDVQFSWSKVLPSGREMRVAPENVTVEEMSYQFRASGSPSSGIATSYMLVTPSHTGEFSRFICRSKNRIGEQKMPCIVSLVSAGPPEPPFNCTATPGDGILRVNCKEGFNGGFSQKFRMDAFLKGELFSNQTSEFPSWTIEGLKEGSEMKIEIRSQNPKGQSDIVTLLAHMPIAHQQSVTEPERSSVHFGPLLGGVLGGILVLLLLFLVALFTVCRRRRVRKVKSDEVMSMDSSDKSAGGEAGPDVVTSVKRRRMSSPAIDVLEYASGAETDGALSTENTDDDASYQLHPSPKECDFNIHSEILPNPSSSTLPKSLIIKPSSYNPTSHFGQMHQQQMQEQQQKQKQHYRYQQQQRQQTTDEYQLKLGQDERRDSNIREVLPHEVNLSQISSQNGGSSHLPQEKLKKCLKKESKKDSYRPYERGKDEKLSVTNPNVNRDSQDVGLKLIEPNTKKDQNLEVLQREGKLEFLRNVQEASYISQTMPNSAKRRNKTPQFNGAEEARRLEEEETLLKEPENYTSERIRESAV